MIVKGQTTGKEENDTLTDPVRCPKKFPLRDSNVRPSRLRSITLTIMLQEPCLQRILLSDSLSLLWLQRAGFSVRCSCGKTIFRAPIFYFSHCSYDTQRRPAFKKTTFQALIVFFALFFETQRSPALQKKHFLGSKKKIFPYCSNETQRSSPLQKHIFSGSIFFFAH